MRMCVDEEVVDVVVDDGIGERVLETVPRSQANGKLTWTSQVIVKVGDLYLVTLRSEKGNKRFGGYLEIGITETRRTGESHKEAARCGLEEELLMPIRERGELRHLFNHFYRHPLDKKDRKNVAVFSYVHNGEIRYDKKEIAAVELLLPQQIDREIQDRSRLYTPMNIAVWDIYSTHWRR